MNKADGKGVRFNKDKIRYELVPRNALEMVADSFTAGSKKYGDFNWQKGMSWTTVLASLERHLHAIKKGEDYDPESGKLHIAHLICNGMILGEYYKIYPQGDDRIHPYFFNKKIGINADLIVDNPDIIKNIKFNLDFYFVSSIKNQKDMYTWLIENNIHKNPSTFFGYNLPQMVIESEVDVYIDTDYEIFCEINSKGKLCYLYDTPENRKFKVGFKRIYSLEDISA